MNCETNYMLKIFESIFTFNGLTLFIAGVSAWYAWKSNEIAKKANLKADRSNQIAKEANELNKIQMQKTTLNSDIVLICEFYKDGLISEWLLNMLSKRSLEKFINGKKLELKECSDEKEIIIKNKKYIVLYDVIIDDKEQIIYCCGHNKRQMELYDGLYSIINDLKFIEPFVMNENFNQAINNYIDTRYELIKVNNYQNRPKLNNELDIKQPCEVQEFMKEEEVCQLWSESGACDKKYEKALFEHLKCFKCTDRNEFDQKINEIVQYYKNFYYFKEILDVYEKSDFEKTLYKGINNKWEMEE